MNPRSLSLKPPFFEFGPKNYLYGRAMVELAEAPTLVLLTTSSIGTIVFATLAVAQLRDALREAEERLVAQAWHLRQLLPPEATAATTGEHPMAPAG